MARSPDLATALIKGIRPRPRPENCGPAGPPERGGRGQETRAEPTDGGVETRAEQGWEIIVATFIRHDERRIVFKRTGNERAGDLLVMGFGALFASGPIYWLCQPDPPDPYRIPLLILLASIGVLICGWGSSQILLSEKLVIDLSRGT